MEQLAIETQYLEASDVAELTALVRDWANVVTLPPRVDEAAYRAILREATVAIGSPRPAWLVDTDLKVVQLASVGYEDYVGIGLNTKPGLSLCNARGVLSVCIAEHVFAMMLAFCRQLPRFLAAQQQSQWSPNYTSFLELENHTLLIVGLGDIGGEVAKRAAGMGMRVVGMRRNVEAPTPPGVDQIIAFDQLPEFLPQADHVVVALPGGKNTKQLLNATLLSQIKPGAFLYNVGRGTAIDQSALINALQTGRLAGAGLDVFEHEPLAADSLLWQMPQVIVTPHIAGYSPGCIKRLGRLMIDNVSRYRAGQPLRNRIPMTDLAG